MTKLSIIIPCYNCEETVEKAIESCYAKPLDNFEIIMVDDGSVDNTKNLLKKLSEKHKEIKVIYHGENKGGGAARNTGIKNSNGDIIFCLDSDNILDIKSLEKMIDFILEKNIDGVAFYERRFFHSKNKSYYSPIFNPIKKEPFIIENLFDGSGLLLDNFLYTKKSFLKTKGYPEHHGFDTQSFEIRYISSGNIVLTCPDTIFYHRQNASKPSYFEREFNKGNFSLNYYLAIEDIWYLFSSYAQREILNYDIFKESSLEKNIFINLQNLYNNNKLFKKQNNEPDSSLYEDFLINYQNKKYSDALDICKKLLENKLDSKLVYYNVLRCSVGISGVDTNKIEVETSKIIEGLKTEPKILNKWYHKNITTLKIIKIINKILKK